jgi:hypothetical protein
MAQMQMAQMAQKTVAPAPAPATQANASVAAALNEQKTQMQSVLSLLRGQGGNVDLMA